MNADAEHLFYVIHDLVAQVVGMGEELVDQSLSVSGPICGPRG